MASSVLTREEFADQLAGQRTSENDPVIVLENGAPAHVWLSYRLYDSLKHSSQAPMSGRPTERSLADLFDHPAFDVNSEEFEIQQLDLKLQGVDLNACS